MNYYKRCWVFSLLLLSLAGFCEEQAMNHTLDNYWRNVSWDTANGAFSADGNYSWEMWFKSNGRRNSDTTFYENHQTLFCNAANTQATTGENAGSDHYLEYDSVNQAIRMRLRNQARTANAVDATAFAEGKVLADSWHHVVVSVGFNGTDTSTIKLWVDGVNYLNTTYAGQVFEPEKVLICTDVSANGGLHGWSDEVRMWNVALADSDVQELRKGTIVNDGAGNVQLTGGSTVGSLLWSDLITYMDTNGGSSSFYDAAFNNSAEDGQTGATVTHDTNYTIAVVSVGELSFYNPTVVSGTPVITTSANPAGFNVEWSSLTDAEGYMLDVSTSSDFSTFVTGYDSLNVGNVTSYAVTGLSNGTYYCRLKAYTLPFEQSSYSETATVDFTDDKALAHTAYNYWVRVSNDTSQSGKYSWETWFYSSNTNQSQDLFCAQGNTNHYLMYDGTDEKMKMRLRNAANDADVVNDMDIAVGEIGKGSWHHVVLSVDYDGTNSSVNLWVDGVNKFTDSTISGRVLTAGDSAWGADNGTLVGTHMSAASGLRGYMDEVRFWNVALTESDVQQLKKGKIVDNGGAVQLKGHNDIGALQWSSLNAYFEMDGSTTSETTALAAGLAVAAQSTAATSFYNPSLATDVPVVAAPAVQNSKDFTFTWDAVTNAQGYLLDVATDSEFSNIVSGYDSLNIGNPSVKEYTVSGLSAGRTYYYRLSVYTLPGEKVGFSNVESAETTTTPVVGLEVAYEDAQLRWSAESEADVLEYRVMDGDTGKILETVKAGEGSYSIELDAVSNPQLLVVDKSGYSQTFSTNVKETLFMDLTPGWNIVSAPFEVNGIDAWVWNGISYEQTDSLQALQGAWVYSDDIKQLSFTGEVLQKAVELGRGWNLVGPVENGYAPEGLLIYGWDSAYQETNVLSVGKGYWVYNEDEKSINLPQK